MKSQNDILLRIKERADEDIFGFEVNEYVPFLNFEHVAPFLKPGTTKEEWNETYKDPTAEIILKRMLEYMPFAWGKANDCRGISAERSVFHFNAWVWLMDDGFYEEYSQIEYEHYGKEKLIAICDKYGWEWRKWDDGVRSNG